MRLPLERTTELGIVFGIRASLRLFAGCVSTRLERHWTAPCEAKSEALVRLPHPVVLGEVTVCLRREQRRRVAQVPLHIRQRAARHEPERGVGVPEVVDAHSSDPDPLARRVQNFTQLGARGEPVIGRSTTKA